MADSSPKTPEKVDKIPKDESFKTCKTTMATPKTRLQLRKLRMTPARASILSGGKPFQEGNGSMKKFNTRRRNNVSVRQQNETVNSNETFTRCEQELMFDRDSLEISNRKLSKSSTPKRASLSLDQLEEELALIEQSQLHKDPLEPQQEILKSQELPKPQEPLVLPEKSKPQEPKVSNEKPLNALSEGQVNNQSLSKQPTFLKKKNTNINNTNRKSPRKGKGLFKKPSPKKGSSPKKTSMPPPALPKVSSDLRRSFITPQVYKKPASLASTASRYLSTWNNSYMPRTRSYKSTAELERAYFSSLRSF